MIDYQTAINLDFEQVLYHAFLKNSDGTYFRCRVNGKCKTWKTRPGEFRLPVKHGLKDFFYIDNYNGHLWTLVPNS